MVFYKSFRWAFDKFGNMDTFFLGYACEDILKCIAETSDDTDCKTAGVILFNGAPDEASEIALNEVLDVWMAIMLHDERCQTAEVSGGGGLSAVDIRYYAGIV